MRRPVATTEAILRSRARKKLGKQKREENLSAQADLLGISSQELKRQKALEAEEIRKKSSASTIRVHVNAPPDSPRNTEPIRFPSHWHW
ncbi:hypothetical protein D4R51_03945 [bacterium]|nr:MAG: hypothetical protein D4R51_03945 [bacterium]